MEELVTMPPPTRFPITSNNANNTLMQIYTVTNNLAGINPQYIGQMCETIQKRKHTWFGSLEAPEDIDLVKQIIGKNGWHLKNLTKTYGVDLIWHERRSNIFMVWGLKPCLISALYGLKKHLHRFRVKHERERIEMSQLTTTLTRLEVESNNPDLVRAREEDILMTYEPDAKRIKCET